MRQFPPKVVSEGDLTTYARVRNAALGLFASRGVAATTIRDVAQQAGVSPGLVQHHFKTKAGLRAAVDEYVVAIAADAFADLPDPPELKDPFSDFADRITAVATERPAALLHVARSVTEGDESGINVFVAFVDIARTQLRKLQRAGLVDRRHDIDWAALHIVVFNLGTLSFLGGVERALGQPFFTEEAIRRWNRASTEILVNGLARRPRDRAPARRR